MKSQSRQSWKLFRRMRRFVAPGAIQRAPVPQLTISLSWIVMLELSGSGSITAPALSTRPSSKMWSIVMLLELLRATLTRALPGGVIVTPDNLTLLAFLNVIPAILTFRDP